MHEVTTSHTLRNQVAVPAREQIPEISALSVSDDQLQTPVHYPRYKSVVELAQMSLQEMETDAQQALVIKINESGPYTIIKPPQSELINSTKPLSVDTLTYQELQALKASLSPEQILARLPTQLAFTDLSEGGMQLFWYLLNTCNLETILLYFSKPLSFKKVQYHHEINFNQFLSLLNPEQILKLLPHFLPIPGLNRQAAKIINALFLVGLKDKLYSKLPATIPLRELTDGDLSTLEYFISEGYSEGLLTLLYFNIDTDELNQGQYDLLTSLALKLPLKLKKKLESHNYDPKKIPLLISLLTALNTKSSLDVLKQFPTTTSFDIIAQIPEHSLNKLIADDKDAQLYIINRFLPKIQLSDLEYHSFNLLASLLNRDTAHIVIDKMGLIDLADLDYMSMTFLMSIQRILGSASVIKKLPTPINYMNVSLQGSNLLIGLTNSRTIAQIVDKLPPQMDAQLITGEVSYLELLIDSVPTKIQSKLTNLDYKNGEKSALLQSKLLLTEHSSTISEYLPKQFDLSSDNPGELVFFSKVTESNLSLGLERLPNKIDLENLGAVGESLLMLLLSKGLAYSIFTRLPEKISASKINFHATQVITELFATEFHQKIVALLEKPFDLQAIGYPAVMIFKNIVEFETLESALRFLPKKIDLVHCTYAGQELVELIFTKYPQSPELRPLIKQMGEALRQPIDVTDWPSQEYYGAPLSSQIVEFPIRKGTLHQIEGTKWYSGRVNKEGPPTQIFMQVGSGTPQIFFRTSKYNPRAIQTYSRASKLLGSYVNGASYPELHPDQPPYFHITRAGYREVYSGQALDRLHLQKLPADLQNSILAQKSYIYAMINYYQILHGHSHSGNLNVRYALQSEGSTTAVVFDLNYAVAKAKQEKLTIVPIVTLRDWDLATSPNAS